MRREKLERETGDDASSTKGRVEFVYRLETELREPGDVRQSGALSEVAIDRSPCRLNQTLELNHVVVGRENHYATQQMPAAHEEIGAHPTAPCPSPHDSLESASWISNRIKAVKS